MTIEPAATEDEMGEDRRVMFRRFAEARDAGLTLVEARLFAESDTDIGDLRRLVKLHCTPSLIARILI